MGRRTLLAMLALVTPAIIAQAQQVGRVTGRVMATEGPPMPSTRITIVGTTRGTVTDSAGRFTIADVPVGSQVVRATRFGYAPAAQTVTVTAGQAVAVELHLSAMAIQLEGVVTT
ncbi:MAG TPA: carboxypeptidase-like regulatory domain-containing protein, partial [Gemmatimonadaceae bacterium]|nr:carboxypeptidase-like regulatory domain-containing protein [Gemmatimonadaceae bacterium]